VHHPRCPLLPGTYGQDMTADSDNLAPRTSRVASVLNDQGPR
jgi:hypothetical protein